MFVALVPGRWLAGAVILFARAGRLAPQR